MIFLQSVSHGVYGINSIYLEKRKEKNLLNPVCLKMTRQMAEKQRGGIKLFMYNFWMSKSLWNEI